MLLKRSILALAVGAVAMNQTSWAANGSDSNSQKQSSNYKQLKEKINKIQAQQQKLKKRSAKLEQKAENLQKAHKALKKKEAKVESRAKTIRKRQKELTYLQIGSAKLPAKSSAPHNRTGYRSNGNVVNVVQQDTIHGASTTFEELPSGKMPFSIIKTKGEFSDNHQALVFGGYIESDTQGWWGDQFTSGSGGNATSGYESGYDTDITTVDFDVMANLNEWAQSFVTFSTGTNDGTFSPGISLRTAFINFGNLDQFPVFLSVGKSRLPLGVFAGGGAWTGSTNQSFFRPDRPVNVTLGYENGGFQTFFSAFSGETKAANDSNTRFNFMYSAYYYGQIPDTKLGYSFNVGYLYDVRGSTTSAGSALRCNAAGVSSTSNCGSGSGASTDTGVPNERNSVLNIESGLSYEGLSLAGGWTATLKERPYSGGGRIGSWYAQFNYAPNLANVPFLNNHRTTYGLSWNQTYNADNIGFGVGGDGNDAPFIYGVQNQFVAFVQHKLFKNVYISAEYARITTYDDLNSSEVTTDISLYF